jgi:hypothetical protein
VFNTLSLLAVVAAELGSMELLSVAVAEQVAIAHQSRASHPVEVHRLKQN